MSNSGKAQKNIVDWFKALDNWNKLAVVIFGLTCLVTIGLMGTVISLNMLPMMYVGVIALLVGLVLFGVFKALFITGFDNKKKKKPKNAVITRLLGLVLALSMVLVDAVGISMISQLQDAIGDMTIGSLGDEAVVYEVVGVYVRADDHADELKDVSAYDLGISYAYSKGNMEKAVSMMEETFSKEFAWDEYDTVVASVDALLAGNEDAILMNTAYIAVIAGMEGYEDIETRVKLIYEFQVEDENATVINLATKPEDVTKESFIVYVSGNDTNYSLTNQRSDVNILVVVNPVTKQVLMINTPRDYYVQLTGSQEADGEWDKLTHCGIYGIECSMATLGDLYDQDVHYYTQVSFVGFKRLIDAMGGINVYSDASFFSSHSETYVEKGYNFMNGEEALSFVRERKNLPDGDNARGRHQMAVIKAIIDKAASGAILTKYGAILDSMGSCFGTNLSADEASDLVKMQLADMASWNIKSFAVIGEGYGESNYTYSVPGQKVYVLPQNADYVDHAKHLIDKVFDGETITDEDLVVPTE